MKKFSIALCFVYVMLLCVGTASAEIDVNFRQSFNFNSNNEIDSGDPVYELRAGWGPVYAFAQEEKQGRIRWGGQHGGPISTQGIGIGFQYKFKRDRFSFIPWSQIGIYKINADLADAFSLNDSEGNRNTGLSHWEALYLKTNKIVGHDPGAPFNTYKMEFMNDGPTYGISAGFDIDYRVWKKFSVFMGVGYTWLQTRYHIWGYDTPELDTSQRHWSVEETLDLSYMTGSIGIRYCF